MSLLKNIPVRERLRIQFRAEFFNSFNHTNPLDPGVSLGGTPNSIVSASSGGFGSIRAAADPRIAQLALKILF